MSVGIAILSGGESRRFQKHGSKSDKALEIVDGKRMIEWVMDTAYQVSNEVVLVVKDEEKVRSYSDIFSKEYPDLLIVADMNGFGHSPLVGLATGARSIEDDLMLVLPCDTPYLKEDVLELLVDRADDFDATLPLWPDGKVETLIAVYKRDHVLLCYPVLLSLGRWRPDDIVRASKRSYLVNVENMREFDRKLDSFFNINYPKDIKSKKRSVSIKGIMKEDKILHPNKASTRDIREAIKHISNRDADVRFIDSLQGSPFWIALTASSLSDKGGEWLEYAGRSFEEESDYYVRNGANMLALHALVDSLSFWQRLNYVSDAGRVSEKVLHLRRELGIDFEGKAHGLG
ncbi:MAG: molybdenum cofactor guanylyltransferase [Nitrososphaerales archaeon]|nr:molybdenum cofactor guanylyltransferase [Nitrososphaerales archaeon]